MGSVLVIQLSDQTRFKRFENQNWSHRTQGRERQVIVEVEVAEMEIEKRDKREVMAMKGARQWSMLKSAG